MNITQVWNTVRYLFFKTYLPDTTPVKHKCREPGYWQHEIQNTWLKCSTGSVPRAINNARTNHFKSALGGATYVYASLDSLPPGVGGAEPKSQKHRRTESINPLQSGRLSHEVQA